MKPQGLIEVILYVQDMQRRQGYQEVGTPRNL